MSDVKPTFKEGAFFLPGPTDILFLHFGQGRDATLSVGIRASAILNLLWHLSQIISIAVAIMPPFFRKALHPYPLERALPRLQSTAQCAFSLLIKQKSYSHGLFRVFQYRWWLRLWHSLSNRCRDRQHLCGRHRL